jgi:hypothetical protein
MNTKHLLVMLTFLLVSACAPSAPTNPIAATIVPTVESTAPASTPVNPLDRFKGTWTGAMSFSDNPNHKGDVDFVILADCSKPGSYCGDFFDNTVPCILAVNLVAVRGDVLEYEFGPSPSPGDPCLDSGRGTLTLQADGTLFREHKAPDLTASGTLTHK